MSSPYFICRCSIENDIFPCFAYCSDFLTRTSKQHKASHFLWKAHCQRKKIIMIFYANHEVDHLTSVSIFLQCASQINELNSPKGSQTQYIIYISNSMWAHMHNVWLFPVSCPSSPQHGLIFSNFVERRINSLHVYSTKRRTNSKRREVQAVRGAVVRLCTGFFVVITASHMAANCGHAECGSLSLLLCVLIETVHNVSTCFFWGHLHTLVLQLASNYSNVSQYQVWQMYACFMWNIWGRRRCLNTVYICVLQEKSSKCARKVKVYLVCGDHLSRPYDAFRWGYGRRIHSLKQWMDPSKVLWDCTSFMS